MYFKYLKTIYVDFYSIFSMAKFEYVLRFRRTKLGVFWNIFSVILTVLLMSIIWSTIFKIDIFDYLPKLLFGVTIYNFITSNITSSMDLFSGKHSHDIQHLSTKHSLYIFRNLLINIFDYFSYFIIFIFIYFFLILRLICLVCFPF